LRLIGNFLPKARVNLVLECPHHAGCLIAHRDRFQHPGFHFLRSPNGQIDGDGEADHVVTPFAHGSPVALTIGQLDIEIGEIFFARKFDCLVVARHGALQRLELRA